MKCTVHTKNISKHGRSKLAFLSEEVNREQGAMSQPQRDQHVGIIAGVVESGDGRDSARQRHVQDGRLGLLGGGDCIRRNMPIARIGKESYKRPRTRRIPHERGKRYPATAEGAGELQGRLDLAGILAGGGGVLHIEEER